MIKRFRSILGVLARRRSFEEGMTDELGFHIDQYTDDLMRSGMSAEEASRRARVELGGLNTIQEECREARGVKIFDEFGRTLRYAARSLRKTPGFTLTALLTLALCLGANLAIFAVLDAILLRPLPFPQAGRLVTIFNTYPKAGVDRDGSSLTNYYERRGHIPAFSSLAIYRSGTAIVGESGSTNREQLMQVSPDFLSTVGRGPALGRAFTEAETTFQTNNVAILSDTYWRSRFGGDPRVLGRRIRIDGLEDTVIGVLPPGFRFLSSDAPLYVPLASRPQDRMPLQRHSGGNVIQMIARLRPGATLAQAQSQIDAQNKTLETDDPQAKMIADAGFRSLVVPLHADHVASIRPTLLLLQAGVILLLLIGGVNLVNLLLIRGNTRFKELGVRQALGASRLHIVGEVVVETTLLTLLGGMLGLGVGAGGIRLLTIFGIDRLPLGTQIGFNLQLALEGLLAAIVIGVVLAAPVAWLHLRRDPAEALQSGTRGGTATRGAQTLRHGFIIAQIAFAFVLLTGAGLLGVSLKRAMAVSPGFQADHVLTGQISLVGGKYPSAYAGLTFTERLLEELGRQPGFVAAGIATNLPFSGRSGKSAATVKGHVLRPGESARGHYSYGVTGDYFRALGFSLRAGRFLTSADSRRPEKVCVVDEDFARYYWPHSSAIGQSLFQGSQKGKDSEAFTIVGVVGSAKQSNLTDDEAQGAVYYPYIDRPDSNFFAAVRASLVPESIALTLRKAVRQIDGDLPVNDLRSMDTRIADSLVARRSPALLAMLFSAVALLLTGVGAYGVLSYAVTQRRREIGVRIALGARPEQIRRQFLSLGLRLLAAGATLGMVGAWLTGTAMKTVLFHVPPLDFAILASAAGVIATVALAACLLPANRAARVSPVQALAQD